MTTDLTDLVESSFFMIRHAGIQPSEVDKLSVYEMRAFVKLTLDDIKKENESDSKQLGSIAKLLSSLGIARKRK